MHRSLFAPSRQVWRVDASATLPSTLHSPQVAPANPRVLVRLDSRLELALPCLRYLPGLADHATVTAYAQPMLYRVAMSVDRRIRVVCGLPRDHYDLDLYGTELQFVLPPELSRRIRLSTPCVRAPEHTVQHYENMIAPQAAGRPRVAWLPSRLTPNAPVPAAVRGVSGFSWHGLGGAAQAPLNYDWMELSAWLDCMHILITADIGFAALGAALAKPVWWAGPTTEAASLIAAGMLREEHTRTEDLPAMLRSWYSSYFQALLA